MAGQEKVNPPVEDSIEAEHLQDTLLSLMVSKTQQLQSLQRELNILEDIETKQVASTAELHKLLNEEVRLRVKAEKRTEELECLLKDTEKVTSEGKTCKSCVFQNKMKETESWIEKQKMNIQGKAQKMHKLIHSMNQIRLSEKGNSSGESYTTQGKIEEIPVDCVDSSVHDTVTEDDSV